MRITWLVLAAALSAGSVVAQPMVLPAPVSVPPMPPGAHAANVTVVRTVIDMPSGKEWATFGQFLGCRGNLVRLKWDASQSEIDAALFSSILKDELVLAGFKPKDQTVDLLGGGQGGGLQIAVLIRDIRARFCGYDTTKAADQPLKGAMRMAIEWQVYDPLNREIIGRFQTDAGGEQIKYDPDWMGTTIFAAARESSRQLLANDEFRKVVTTSGSQHATGSVVETKLGPISLTAKPSAKRSISDASGSVVAIFANDGHGSGFLVSDDGYLITNHHVVGGSKFVKVRWSDGFETVGEVIRSDKRRDVALVKTDPHGRTALGLRRGGLQPGEAVFALGTPLDPKFQGTVTKGVMSSTRILDGFSYIQSDVTVNPGNSGGPLRDEKGAVIGITVLAYRPDDLPTGINLFIPIGDALDFLNLKPAA